MTSGSTKNDVLISIMALWLVFTILFGSFANGDDSTSSLTSVGIPTDDETSSHSSSSSQESPENEIQDNDVTRDVLTTTPGIVLQPNIAGALDVGQGLLVPLIPVVDPNSKTNTPSNTSPLMANLLPVTVENVTPSVTVDSGPQIEMNQPNDMDVAEDIVFRPLFRYRQEAARRRQYNNRYYQPYVYAYKKRQNIYSNRQRSRYYNTVDDDD